MSCACIYRNNLEKNERILTYQNVNNGYQWVAEFQMFPLCFFSNFSPRNVELMGRTVEEKKETNVHWEMGL